jgi:uncharacterized protein YodC (DUF2158 family)
MSAPFQIGDVVELKSGGPDMTVESIEDLKASCVWFDKGDMKRALFPSNTLQKVQTF